MIRVTPAQRVIAEALIGLDWLSGYPSVMRRFGALSQPACVLQRVL